MKSIAFYLDEIPFVQEGSALVRRGYARQFIDQWCAMVDLTPIWIDTSQQLKKTNGNVFWSWEELVDTLSPNHQIVFLDQNGKTLLKDFIHPTDNIIYCVGGDYDDGFGSIDLDLYKTIKLDTNRSCYGFSVVPFVAASRSTK